MFIKYLIFTGRYPGIGIVGTPDPANRAGQHSQYFLHCPISYDTAKIRSRSRSVDEFDRNRRRSPAVDISVVKMEAYENEIASLVAQEIKKSAEQEGICTLHPPLSALYFTPVYIPPLVSVYVQSDDYKMMVETLKRRERERMMAEVTTEIAKEKEALLRAEREKIKKEIEESKSVEEILAENQRRIEVMCVVSGHKP